MKKQLLSPLLVLCMVLALLPGTALAAETSGTCGDNLAWSLSDGTLTIQGTGSMDDYYDDDGAILQSPWFGFEEQIQAISIGDGVTSIGAYAFYYLSVGGVASVVIPDSVTSVGLGAFSKCGSLTDVYYTGSESQWQQVNIERDNEDMLYATIHCNDADPATTPAPDPTPTTPAQATNAVLSPQKLTVDGKDVDCEKYNIGGSNYFKLRDLAYVLSGTASQFEVGFDEETSTVTITTGAAYTSNGSELAVGVDNASTAQTSRQAILIDGVERSDLTAYNIGGSNFFQLRELGAALGFDVDFDADSNTAIVRSTQG